MFGISNVSNVENINPLTPLSKSNLQNVFVGSVILTNDFLPLALINCINVNKVSLLNTPCSVSKTIPSHLELQYILVTSVEGICCQSNFIIQIYEKYF